MPCSPRCSPTPPESSRLYRRPSLSLPTELSYNPVQAQSIPGSSYSFSEGSLRQPFYLLYTSTPSGRTQLSIPGSTPAPSSSGQNLPSFHRQRPFFSPTTPVPDPVDTTPSGRARDTTEEMPLSHFESLIAALRDQHSRGSDACRRRIEQELAAMNNSRRQGNDRDPCFPPIPLETPDQGPMGHC